MIRLLRRPSTYVSLPILLTCGITWLTYDLPAGYTPGLILLCLMALAIMMLDTLSGFRLPDVAKFRVRSYIGTREGLLALAFAGLILCFCVLDLTLFPVPLFDAPSAYANMQGGRDHIRHVSDICWVLPPIGMLCVRNRLIRYAFIAIGLVFPILIIDRNRIFAALFAMALVIVLRRPEGKPLPWKLIGVLAVAGAVIFSLLGLFRSGTLDYVTLPFSPMYKASPQGIKWLLLYASAGPYNFSAMLAKHYHNATFLTNQLVPFAGSIATAGTDIPLDASNINVGTEFFPFLMAWGPPGAAASIIALYAMLVWSVRRLHPAVPLFSLLIFLRVSYVCVMAPFAPQAFIWTNFGFIAVCLVLQAVAAWLPNRRESEAPHAAWSDASGAPH